MDEEPSDPGDNAPAPLLELRDGLPQVIEDEASLGLLIDKVRSGSGPVALDAERASGYRYSQRAYLIQLRREGVGSALIDPIACPDLTQLNQAIGDAEWILHAATQDLPCLRELGLQPRALFDTELAARLLGYPRVGLATLVETITGQALKKEHSAVDWSTRPLPEPWLEYAALDVEVLIELRAHLAHELLEQGKQDWAAQEFHYLLDFEPTKRAEPWRRTSGIHRVKQRRGLAIVKSLWTARDELAAQSDLPPGRLIPDSALVAVAKTVPKSRGAMLATKGFHGRGAKRHAQLWFDSISEAVALKETDLPSPSSRNQGPPTALRAWVDKDRAAAERLTTARGLIAAFCEKNSLPTENLLTPDHLRRVLWKPPKGEDLLSAVAESLGSLGARVWQIEITAPLIVEATVNPQPLPESKPKQEDGQEN